MQVLCHPCLAFYFPPIALLLIRWKATFAVATIAWMVPFTIAPGADIIQVYIWDWLLRFLSTFHLWDNHTALSTSDSTCSEEPPTWMTLHHDPQSLAALFCIRTPACSNHNFSESLIAAVFSANPGVFLSSRTGVD